MSKQSLENEFGKNFLNDENNIKVIQKFFFDSYDVREKLQPTDPARQKYGIEVNMMFGFGGDFARLTHDPDGEQDVFFFSSDVTTLTGKFIFESLCEEKVTIFKQNDGDFYCKGSKETMKNILQLAANIGYKVTKGTLKVSPFCLRMN